MADKTSFLTNIIPGLVCFFILTIALLFIYFHQLRKRQRIKQWQKSLNLQEHQLTFQQLYQHVDGFQLSQQGRKRLDAIEFTYGEIEFLPFIALLSLVSPDHKTIFYDLGSGTGKASLACAMVYPVSKCVGIELLPELHQAACEQVARLAMRPNYIEKAKKIEFILGDFLKVNLDEATLVFVNSTTILGAVWEHLSFRLNNLPNLHTIITTSKTITVHDSFHITSTKIEMSWGIVEAYIHTRKTNFN
ncbi:class I SAM-dependent methyltransferase [Legionella fallonii]|uniref:Histone-lysine N-methyltransferase, H3 lysine-79 specific n=1 Tax=Legionella fallonii LLAP-10 TaxID=1212491 RepID=A0A098GC38_9GAMM|nr:methyltransferase [Legionella fallonii]CEG59051.1 putative methyltransferases [Legionella fallonii LLAP-10]